jgi:signal transduction histidine kinase/DNA-binding NarL/FixJ family response regulator
MSRSKNLLLIAGLLLIIIVQGLSLWSILEMRRTTTFERSSAEMHTKIDDILDDARAAVSSKRGYLLSGNPQYRTDYDLQLASLHERIDLLSAQLNNEQFRILVETQFLVRQYQELFERLLAGDDNAATPEMRQQMISDNIEAGNRLWESIHHKLSNLKDGIKKEDIYYIKLIEQEFTLLITTIVLVSALSILIFIAFSISVKKEFRQRDKEARELEQARAEALEASMLKSKFLATVSHEVRTPLNGIIGMSEILLHSPIQQENRSLVEAIKKSGDSLLKIINDILDYSKINTSSFTLHPHRFKINDIIQQVSMVMIPLALKKNITFSTQIDPGLPAEVIGDSERLSQILFNLVGNGIKFTSKGSVALTINRKASNLKENTVLIEFVVEDTGIGISEETIKRLFRPFVQGQTVGTSNEPGTGLGLAITQSILEAMQGSIKLESALGKGSTFTFEIPFNVGSRETIDVRLLDEMNDSFGRPEDKSFGLGLTHSPRFLVVEDNFTNQMVLQLMLIKFGGKVSLVNNGEEALKALAEQSYDIIFMDCQMPVMGGLEATRRIRQFDQEIPIIGITANASGTDKEECFEVGMNSYVAKPFSIDDIYCQLIRFVKHTGVMELDLQVLKELKHQLNHEAAEKIWQTYLSTLPQFASRLNESMRDLEHYRRLGHQFKSSSLSVGAMRLALLCKRLEQAETMAEVEAARVPVLQSIEQLTSMNLQVAQLELLN